MIHCSISANLPKMSEGRPRIARTGRGTTTRSRGLTAPSNRHVRTFYALYTCFLLSAGSWGCLEKHMEIQQCGSNLFPQYLRLTSSFPFHFPYFDDLDPILTAFLLLLRCIGLFVPGITRLSIVLPLPSCPLELITIRRPIHQRHRMVPNLEVFLAP